MAEYGLSTIARRLAREISTQDWSDVHSRADGARHNRAFDHTRSDQLDADTTDLVRMNVIWVVAQALADDDPNFSVRAFAKAAGAPESWLLTRRGQPNGGIEAGVRPRFAEEIAVGVYPGSEWSARSVDDHREYRIQGTGEDPVAAVNAMLRSRQAQRGQ